MPGGRRHARADRHQGQPHLAVEDAALPAHPEEPAETEFFLVGWGVPTFDSEYIFSFLHHTRDAKFGSWNALRYSNPDLDRKIEALSSETDTRKRNAAIAEIWKFVQDETLYLPVHHQTLAYAMRNSIDVPVDPQNQPHMKYVAFKGS
jgi:peptide/nickel transport system substrate-binding protein